jgi:hypothetical protein
MSFLPGRRCDLRILLLGLTAMIIAGGRAAAHNPATDPPEPVSVPEAWNVISQCTANVQTLIQTNQLSEIGYQIANISPAIRLLQAHIREQERSESLAPQLEQLFSAGGNVILAARDKKAPLEKTRLRLAEYQALVKEVAAYYPRQVVNADVYICPMHPLDRHLEADEKCSLCHMSLIRRRLVASSTYEKPGETSVLMTATADAPLQAGKPAHVRVRFSRRDGSPVLNQDLLVIHTQRIHLLINDHSLGDYHHEHPAPTSMPGEYEFTFTPRRDGPYRVVADIVPAATSIQEYAAAELPAQKPGGEIDDRQTRLRAEADGLRFELDFGGRETSLRATEPLLGHLTVKDADGKPFAGLEPVMGAFGHFVGFFDDRKAVIHVHPAGPEPQQPGERGGPVLPFYLYAPRDGYLRFYVQVRVGGIDHFAAFGLNVAPAASIQMQ